MPDVVTHLYDPAVGVCPDICALPDMQAERVLDRLRRTYRPGLKFDYLSRRRTTDAWLREKAYEVLGRRFDHGPGYFFLGDFSHTADSSRPAALILPLSTLPANAITFTLGDSMSVVQRADAKAYSLGEIAELFTADTLAGRFSFSDRDGFQANFIEVQLWDRSPLFRSSTRISDSSFEFDAG